MIRLMFLGALLSFGILGYWGHDLPMLNSPAEALPPESTPPSALEPVSDPVAEVEQESGRANSGAASLSDGVIKMATSLASRSRYTDAIALLETIPTEDENFTKANQLQNQWGRAILAIGQAKLKQGKVSEGIAILKSVPRTTDSYAEAAKLSRKS
jgi:hypothetical protein